MPERRILIALAIVALTGSAVHAQTSGHFRQHLSTQPLLLSQPTGQTHECGIWDETTKLLIGQETRPINVPCDPEPVIPIVAPSTFIVSALRGLEFSDSLAVTGGRGTISYHVTGEFPEGVQFSGGTLSGQASEAGSTPFAIEIIDESVPTQRLTVQSTLVVEYGLTLAAAQNQSVINDTNHAISPPAVSMQEGTVSYALLQSPLPAGFSFSGGQLRIAAATSPRQYGPFNWVASDSRQSDISNDFYVDVAAPVARYASDTRPFEFYAGNGLGPQRVSYAAPDLIEALYDRNLTAPALTYVNPGSKISEWAWLNFSTPTWATSCMTVINRANLVNIQARARLEDGTITPWQVYTLPTGSRPYFSWACGIPTGGAKVLGVQFSIDTPQNPQSPTGWGYIELRIEYNGQSAQ